MITQIFKFSRKNDSASQMTFTLVFIQLRSQAASFYHCTNIKRKSLTELIPIDFQAKQN